MYTDNSIDLKQSYTHAGLAQEVASSCGEIDVSDSKLEWENPILFNDIETPEIPASLLPGIYGNYATSLAESSETPPGLAVMSILGVISACVAKYYVVSPKVGWAEPTNIYTMIAMQPGSNKSLILKSCTQPLIDWEKSQREIMQPTILRLRSEHLTYVEDIKRMRKDVSRLKDNSKKSELAQEIADKEINLPDIPALPQLFTNDATPESLTQNVAEQYGRFSIFTDEGGILDTLSGLYSNGNANVDILLKGIDGGDIRVNRKDRTLMLNPYLSIVMTIQPIIIQNMASKKTFQGKGMFERFLFVLPKSRLGFRTHNTAPLSDELKAKYHQAINELLERHPHQSDIEATKLMLSEEATAEWRSFQLGNEKMLRPDGTLSHCSGWGGKISGMALRLAGLLHVMSGGGTYVIPKKTMNSALTLAALLSKHALAVYDSVGMGEDMSLAKYLYEWVAVMEGDHFTQSQLTIKLKNKKPRDELRNNALKILIERNIISEAVTMPSHGKATTQYLINPQLKGISNVLA